MLITSEIQGIPVLDRNFVGDISSDFILKEMSFINTNSR